MTEHDRQLDLFRHPVMPLPPRDRTHGLLVQSTACRCGCELAVIDEGKGPHVASLHCYKCDLHRGWVSHATHKFLTEIVTKFGRPVKPIILRCTPQMSSDDGGAP